MNGQRESEIQVLARVVLFAVAGENREVKLIKFLFRNKPLKRRDFIVTKNLGRYPDMVKYKRYSEFYVKKWIIYLFLHKFYKIELLKVGGSLCN